MAAETNRRSYGTGSLFEKSDKRGRVSYYGQWRHGDLQVKRKIGPKRLDGSTEGLTKTQAEKQLQKLMAEVKPAARAAVHMLTIGEVGERYLTHLEKMKGRKLSTRTAVESTLRIHLEPYFGERGIATVTRVFEKPDVFAGQAGRVVDDGHENGATLLSCAVTSSSPHSCSNASGSGSAGAGDNIQVKITATGESGNKKLWRVTFRF